MLPDFVRASRAQVPKSIVAQRAPDITVLLGHRRAGFCLRHLALLKLGVALDAQEHGAHLVSLGEDDLVDLALIERIKQAVQLAHRFAYGRQLVIRDAQAVGGWTHRQPGG
ncbi:MAG: hypothetical protein ACRDL8_15085 [Solirubrobacteraceae bacterium]